MKRNRAEGRAQDYFIPILPCICNDDDDLPPAPLRAGRLI